MKFIHFLSKTFSKINRNNHPFSKYTNEQKKEYLVYYPAVIGSVFGAKIGWDGGFELTKYNHCFINVSVTAFTMFYGSIVGAAMGAIWPISISIMAARQFVTKKVEN